MHTPNRYRNTLNLCPHTDLTNSPLKGSRFPLLLQIVSMLFTSIAKLTPGVSDVAESGRKLTRQEVVFQDTKRKPPPKKMLLCLFVQKKLQK